MCVVDSSLSLADEQLEQLTDILFDDADENNDGSITFDEFKEQFDQHPDVIDNLCIRYISLFTCLNFFCHLMCVLV